MSTQKRAITNADVAMRDPAYVAQWIPVMKAVVKGWHRSEVRDLGKLPDGGALVVGNHSGGMLPMDVPVFATDLFETFGTEQVHTFAAPQ
ncbi:hypothetical protein ACKUT9_22340 [Mycobacterium seoulense]|uniref:hypothetical protein n=1 Tax=Mycobacterium seoulense TaxID=386911 RepID=UPI003CEA4777